MVTVLACACTALTLALVAASRSAYLWRREAIEQSVLRRAEAVEHSEFLQRIDQMQRINRAIVTGAIRGVSNDQCN